jgi:hypothetical protein
MTTKYSAVQGSPMTDGTRSKSIEEAIKWRRFEQTIAEARGKFADMTPEALEALIDEGAATMRAPGLPGGKGSGT